MHAEVVVLTYQSPDIPTYTYLIPTELEKEIKVGQLVSVPFGKRNPSGIIINLDTFVPRQEIEIKAIASIILKNPTLLPYQIELLKWMADYYHAPMVNCLEALLPDIPQRLNTENRGLARDPTKPNLEQKIILTPSISRIPETLAKYPQAKSYAIYHTELKASERFAVWQKILSGGIDHVFGSRSAIFTPCPNLKEIIMYDEHEELYRDQRSPYYNTLTLAEKISGLTGAKIKIVDTSPRITTYFNYSTIMVNKRDFVKKKGPNVKIVNMLDEKKAGNKSPLSQILEEYIKKGWQRNKKILLFLNKKSESGHVYCRNCKYSDFAAKPPEICPKCQSPDIFFNSTNVGSLAPLVRKLVPGANVNIISKITKTQATSNILKSIDIATASVFYKLMPQKYDLVAHMQTDSLANITDYSSAERLYSQIESLKKITQGLLLLQTYNPQNLTITSAAQGNWQKFYQSQLAERKALSYPPFVLLVKLSAKGKKEEGLEQKAQTLYENLQAANFPVQILGPYKPIGGKLSRYNIILKIPLNEYSLKDREKAMTEISPLLSKVPKFWQTEVQTNSLN